MASTPLFELDDQTDEDFFDKLMEEDDDDGIIGAGTKLVVDLADSDDSAEAKAFANLSLEKELDLSEVDRLGIQQNVQGAGEAIGMVSSDSFSFGDEIVFQDKVDKLGSRESTLTSSSSFSFHDEVVHKSNDFGSSSDSAKGVKVDNMNNGSHVVSNNEAGENASLQDYSYDAGYEMGHGTFVDQTTTGTNSNQNLEKLYPGWKYDPASGNWYQVEGYAAIGNVQGNFDGNLSSNHYAQHSFQLVSGNANQVNAIDNTSSRNQVPQGRIEYPGHMAFDPQYPGWYYDTNSQEWYSLETLNFNQHTVVQTHQQLQSDCTSSPAFPILPLDLPRVKEKNPQVRFSPDTNQNSLYVSQQLGGARSSAIRPPHALVTFGFGGKLVVMKDNSVVSSFHGTQDAQGQGIYIFNLMEVVFMKHTAGANNEGACSYFHALCRQSFSGPLVGGSVGGKELSKWIDERISNYKFSGIDHEKEVALKLLLSLLKIACQHYGKLRSLGTDSGMRESDVPEATLAKLFASIRGDAWQFGHYSAFKKCLTNWPSEAQVQATASEIENLLVNGRKMEALQCAQEGHSWAIALILARELGDQFYASTLKQMALSQLVAGTPLRTLCLLIAKSPEEVFGSNTMDSGVVPSPVRGFAQPAQKRNGIMGTSYMLDNWAENLAIITANRTENDNLVITHLGDCLWKEKNDIFAAHTCYLLVEAEFESYSKSARLCLIGADHLNFPRTYFSPDAIQRTELLEYSKVLGNSQFVLKPFQPYKILYAHMLAEVGKVSDSLKYCQAVYKCLKTARSPEVDAWRQIISSLEDRIKTHQQGGYSVNLAPTKIFGNLLKAIDSTAQRVVGPPSPVALSTQSGAYGAEQQTVGPPLASSQSTMSISTLTRSASMEHDQVVSSKEPATPKAEAEGSNTTTSARFGRFRFGTQILQRTIGLLKPRQGQQAKLGEENKFYYDEKMKRWVEAGVDPPPAEDAALPPPLTPLSNTSNSGPESENSSTSAERSSGIPSIPPNVNQFSAKSRMGVRSRYVDTFNKGGGSPANVFPKPSVSPIKPTISAGAKFFVPAPSPSSSTEQLSATGDQEVTSESKETQFVPIEDPFKKLSPSPSTIMPRFKC